MENSCLPPTSEGPLNRLHIQGAHAFSEMKIRPL